MKKNIPLLLFLCIFLQIGAQAQNVNVTGTVLDDGTKEGIELASVSIMNARDSSYVTGGTSNLQGKFSVSVKPGRYIAHISFLGYVDQYFNVNTSQKTALGNIFLKEDSFMLSETVVVGIPPEIVVKGDTVEYNADAYKVQENAVLADLIKRVPGAEIDSEGKITINGKDINKILVDGKEFFSEDPKTASENLPAKMVEKLQVLDQKSDMALLTGFDDGEEQTVINLVSRPGMKEGIMGSLSGGYGSEDRYETNGFLNIARNSNRFSAVGNFNNNNNANAGNMGGRGGWGGDRGLTETAMGGVNFAMEPSERFKFDGDIQYRGTDNDVESTSSTEYLDNDMIEVGTTLRNNKNKNINSRFKLEWKPDDLTSIIFRPNLTYTKTNSSSIGNSERSRESEPINNFTSLRQSGSDGNSLRFNGSLLINRKLSDKGRSITLEVSGGFTDGKTDGFDYSEIGYYNKDSLAIQDQIYNQKNKSYNLRGRISYLEPIGTNNFIELAYDISNNYSETDKITYEKDAAGNYNVIAEEYTKNTQNDFLNQRISLNFQARRQKYNYTIGAELIPSRSQTSVIQPNMTESKDRARNFMNFAPRLEFNYLWDKRHNLRIRYNGRTNQASTNQLYDGIISQSATDTTWGNPNLKPSFIHSMNVRYQKFNVESGSSITSFINLSYTTNAIASITRVGEGNSRNTTYENIDGNMTGMMMIMYNTPLKNRKFSINNRIFGNYTRDNTFVTNKGEDPSKNTANTYRISEDLRLRYNSDKVQFSIGGNFTYEDTRHSFSKSRNQAIYNYSGYGDFQWFLPYSFVLATDINYSSNSGYESGYEQNSWIWNASLAKEFNIKLKSGEKATKLPATLSFKIYDIFKDRSNINRSANAQSISYNTYNTISSYFMVGLTIRFQSFKGMSGSDMQGGGRRGWGGGGPGGGRPN